MEPMNGLDATKQLIKLVPSAKIIGMSIHDQPSYARNMINAGAKGYMTKNSSREEMTKAIIAVHKGSIYICEEVKDKMNKDEPA